MMRHKHQKVNLNRAFNLKRTKKKHQADGLNKFRYYVREKLNLTGFTYIKVDIGQERY